MEGCHRPVLCRECLQALQVAPDGIYVDATFGRGGHSRQILEQLGESGHLYALDRDPEAVAAGRRWHDMRFSMLHARFSRLQVICEEWGILGRVQGLLLDIGVSSPQLADARRGFSFMLDGPLDMRMDPGSEGPDAAELVNSCSPADLERMFREYGEERYAGRVARAIVAARQKTALRTTAQLREIVVRAVPAAPHARKHCATRVFQALRIAVNAELEELAAVLEASPAVLAPGGVLAVIAFHSLEDRMVKRFMRRGASWPELLQRLPLTEAQIRERAAGSPVFSAVRPPIRAGAQEVTDNRRARSATLRSAVRAGGIT